MEPLPPPLDALHRALRAEEEAERNVLRELADRSLEDRIAAGVSWPLLSFSACERQGKGWRTELRAPKGVVLHDGIGAGDPIFARVAGRALPGICLGHDGKVVELLTDEPLPEGPRVELTRRADPSTWVRYRQALEKGAAHKGLLARRLLAGGDDRATGQGALLHGLDPAQQEAADQALRCEALAAIHGPPGTGKTRVLGAMLAELVRQGDRPWALADSNAATDHLALAAQSHGLRVVRLGHAARIDPAAAELGLEAHLSRSPLAPALASLDRDLARCDEPRERRHLIAQRHTLRDQARAHVLDQAQVLACTFGTLARLAPDLPPARTAVVDEATQATEPAVWVAVPFVQRLILVGDPEQLGPVARVPGSPLERSLLQRLLDAGQVTAPMLQVQHRMDARLRALVADVYGPTYVDHPAVACQPLLDGPPARWIDTAGAGLDEQLDPLTRSTFNPGEVRLVGLVVDQLLADGIDPARVAVITPYAAQVARLQDRLPSVKVASVNAFQGREVDAMVVSWVRSNPDGELGFVADGRRLTVGLTRARRLLVQVGDSATLGGHPRFARVLEHIAEEGGLSSAFEPPWDEAL